MSEDAMKC